MLLRLVRGRFGSDGVQETARGAGAASVCESKDLRGGLSCGFEGAGLRFACGVGAGGEFAETVGRGDACLGGDGFFADGCDAFEGVEELPGLWGFEVFEQLVWGEVKVRAELGQVERAVEEGVHELGLVDVVGELGVLIGLGVCEDPLRLVRRGGLGSFPLADGGGDTGIRVGLWLDCGLRVCWAGSSTSVEGSVGGDA